MVGRVYRVSLTGRYDDKPHPLVVVIEFSGSRECLLVPAFSADGHAIRSRVEAYLARGFRPDQVCVELDNATHVAFDSGHSGKDAIWLTAEFLRLSTATLNASACIGQMDLAGLRKVVEGLLEFAQLKPELFSPALLKKLRRLDRQD